MITMSQTPDVGPNPVHFSQNSLPGQCLPDPGQLTVIHTSFHWEFPSCFHLSAHSNSKLSPAHVPFLPGLGPTSLMSLHILLLSLNLFSDCPSIFLNTTCPHPESTALQFSVQTPQPGLLGLGLSLPLWPFPTIPSKEPCLHLGLILPRSLQTCKFIPNAQHLLKLLQCPELLLF